MSIEQRFWAKVRLSGSDDGCMEWSAAKHGKGYGMLKAGGRMVYAHRFSYELNVGPIPAGLVIDHLCRNRACVRPDHLEPVTPRLNVLRGEGVAARNAVKTHCVNEHEFTEENTYMYGRERMCRTCGRERMRRRRRG